MREWTLLVGKGVRLLDGGLLSILSDRLGQRGSHVCVVFGEVGVLARALGTWLHV
jgi:hypothetical protein